MPKLKRETVWPQPAKAKVTRKDIEEMAIGPMTYDQILEEYGEEVAIDVGIARDPDTWEWTEGDFARARPAAEAVPHLVESWHSSQTAKKTPA